MLEYMEILKKSENYYSKECEFEGVKVIFRCIEHSDAYMSDFDAEFMTMLKSVVKTITSKSIDEFINTVYFIKYRNHKIDIIIDAVPKHRPVFFGKRFHNISSIKRLTSNLSAKFNFNTKSEYIVKVYAVEGY